MPFKYKYLEITLPAPPWEEPAESLPLFPPHTCSSLNFTTSPCTLSLLSRTRSHLKVDHCSFWVLVLLVFLVLPRVLKQNGLRESMSLMWCTRLLLTAMWQVYVIVNSWDRPQNIWCCFSLSLLILCWKHQSHTLEKKPSTLEAKATHGSLFMGMRCLSLLLPSVSHLLGLGFAQGSCKNSILVNELQKFRALRQTGSSPH